MNANSTRSSKPLPVRLWQRAWAWALHVEGSTRSSALLRIAIVFCLWTRWGERYGLFVDPSWSTLALGACFYLGSILLLLGLWTRVAAVATGAAALFSHYYLGVHLHTSGWGNHHMKLLAISTALLAFTPCGRSYSLDRWLALRRARREGKPPPEEHGDLWGLRLLAIFLSSLYLSTAYHKTMGPWLSGVRMEQIFGAHYMGSMYMSARWWTLTMQFLALSTWAIEGLLPIALWFERTRKWAVLSGIVMHLLFYAFFEVYTFSVNMIVIYLAFIPPQVVHDIIDRLHGHDRKQDPGDAEPRPETQAQPHAAAWPMWLGGAAALAGLVALPAYGRSAAEAQALAEAEAKPPAMAEPEQLGHDPFHPSSVGWTQLSLRSADAGEGEPDLDWGELIDGADRERREAEAKQKNKPLRNRWPPEVHRLDNPSRVRGAARKTCRLAGPDAQLLQRTRVATAEGWAQERSSEGNVCPHRGPSATRPKSRVQPKSHRGGKP